MTRTQTRAYGVIAPSSRQPLLEAMLCVFACLLSNVGSKLRTIFNRNTRDWHTDRAEEVQLQPSTDITEKEPQPPQPSFSGKRKARIPRMTVASSQGTTPHSLRAINRDARDKPEHDAIGFASSGSVEHAFPTKAVIQSARHARSRPIHSLLSFRAKAHRAVDPEPRSHTHRHPNQPLGSGSRASRASGTTMQVRPKSA